MLVGLPPQKIRSTNRHREILSSSPAVGVGCPMGCPPAGTPSHPLTQRVRPEATVSAEFGL